MIGLFLAMMLADTSASLHLICPGAGMDTKVGVSSAYAFASNGQSAAMNANHRRAVEQWMVL